MKIINILEQKSRIYDVGLVTAGTVQSYNLWDIPTNVMIKLVEDPIVTVIGLITIFLVILRCIRMIQKISSNEGD